MDVRTLEASPGGLANFTVDQKEQGRALMLSWDDPLAPNGVITVSAKRTLNICFLVFICIDLILLKASQHLCKL